ncbi:MAG: EAL domain-containing protein [Sulfuricurvum sp.]|uniref:sensor domain-containing phosphodiesterase n=1 Tax=Sulfuricurvum sp. TaxID=2025608 RepID=UPI002734CC9B|nr:EAL domain-containing protein [Sulfuricurvum sp.]MDP2850227.1 EAL domain-containing protein [Sulfuricurvum sp.]
MSSPTYIASPFRQNLWQSVAILILTIISFVIYVAAEKRIDRANEMRLHSFLLADELRQSSDDLTRMIRTYAATGNPLYKKHYEEILDIRNGKKPRPLTYQNIYWDLVGLNNTRPRPLSTQSIPLIEMMRQAGFTEAEFAKLSEAKNNSDALTQTEFRAMKLIESNHAEKAFALLHDAAYHRAKLTIMSPIGEFYDLMNARTSAAVHSAETTAFILRIIFILMGIFLFIMLWRLHKTLQTTLGSSLEDVHAHIMHIGSGDFSHPITLKYGSQESILGWLSETQQKLKELLTTNERLKNLYAALSQCNQAIVRSSSEAELFPLICRDAIDFGGMKMAWIGMLDPSSNSLKSVSCHGEGTDYLEGFTISTDSTDITKTHGPTGGAFHENRPFWCQDFQNDPTTAPWHERGKQYGWGSSAALPLTREGKVVGVFSLYAQEKNAFDDAAQKLLEEMAMDISFALELFSKEMARVKAEKQIQYLANYDELTGLPNRLKLDNRIQYLLSLAKRNEIAFTVMFLDLDHFKTINDTLGHSCGDSLLIEASKRLKMILREEDTIARFGGDEFIILLPNIGVDGATQVAQKLLNTFQEPFPINEHELCISSSIGIALYPNDGNDFETLYKNADTAMYRAKKEGRNRFCFFTMEMQRHSVRNLELSNALRYALERNQLELHYQPQFSTQKGTVIGAEALLRWNHSELGSISPSEFIPIAEENGMILSIGEWVLHTAIKVAKEWMDGGYSPLIMAVNLSAVQFRSSNLPALIAAILEDVGLPPEYLELELTESIAMDDPQKAINTMNELHTKGIRMSIDDFGTGHSSLSYLKKFKIYKLKIDQSFVRDINIDPEDKAIVSAIISMSKSLGLQTIAEGVETIAQLNYLREEKCDEIQGYYFSKPLPKKAFKEFRDKYAF